MVVLKPDLAYARGTPTVSFDICRAAWNQSIGSGTYTG